MRELPRLRGCGGCFWRLYFRNRCFGHSLGIAKAPKPQTPYLQVQHTKTTSGFSRMPRYPRKWLLARPARNRKSAQAIPIQFAIPVARARAKAQKGIHIQHLPVNSDSQMKSDKFQPRRFRVLLYGLRFGSGPNVMRSLGILRRSGQNYEGGITYLGITRQLNVGP